MPRDVPKYRTKKLRDGPVISVDMQIINWRKKLKAKGIKLGKGMEHAEKRAERIAEQRATEREIDLKTKKWF